MRARKQNFTLGYDNGTAAFTAGKTLTGATSHATAVIVSVSGTAASGTLTLHTITGTFQNNEAISDNGTVPGAALVDGTIAEAFDANHELTYTDIDTAVACKFYQKTVKIQTSGGAISFESVMRLMLPATVTPEQGDLVISTETGFTGTWVLGSPKPLYGPPNGSTLHHWEAELAKGGA
jgi:hypothetical protein